MMVSAETLRRAARCSRDAAEAWLRGEPVDAATGEALARSYVFIHAHAELKRDLRNAHEQYGVNP
jgi:hypothetical protein